MRLTDHENDILCADDNDSSSGFWSGVRMSDIIDIYSDDDAIARYIERKRREFRREWAAYISEME